MTLFISKLLQYAALCGCLFLLLVSNRSILEQQDLTVFEVLVRIVYNIYYHPLRN
jgi:hypothetical protein